MLFLRTNILCSNKINPRLSPEYTKQIRFKTDAFNAQRNIYHEDGG